MALSANMNVMLRAAEKASRSLVRDFGEVEQLQVSMKGPGDFVSAADMRAEKIIFEELQKARPDFGFLMEESGVVKGKDTENRWIIDPLDGTTNFLHGIPYWAISIALEHKGEIVAGLIYDPITDEMFRAEKGDGAFMRNKRLRVSGRRDLPLSVIVGGSAGKRPERSNLSAYLKQVENISNSGAGYRKNASASLDLAYVAAGRYDAYWESSLKPWDVAAGFLIVKEAGGYVGTLDGKGDPVFGGDIFATNGNLTDPVRKLLTSSEAAAA
ncbi:MAG: Inositol-monophosphatase [Micavibrio sp.]|nr:Inositol-monophosphatase [Micavibrio sp.]